MNKNPLQQYFRQPALYINLPSGNRWYTESDIKSNETGEIAVYGLTAIDDIMLNTPDAMLNGQALEKVISNCVPDILNVKNITLGDLDAIFVAIKLATTGQGYPIDRDCPSCNKTVDQDLNCRLLLDTMSHIEESDTVLMLNQLKVHVSPYRFYMRHAYMQRQYIEQSMVNQISDDIDDFTKSQIVAESVERLSKETFGLLSNSVVSVELPNGVEVTDKDNIREWMFNICCI